MRFGGTYLETATWGSNGLTPSQIRNRENWPIIAAWYDAHHESYQRFDNAFQRAHQVCPFFPENQRQFATTVIVLATLGPVRKVTEIGIGYLGSQAGNAFRGLNWLYNRGKTLYDVKQAADVNPSKKEIPGRFEGFPDRDLPSTGKNNRIKVPDADALENLSDITKCRPYTQLGTRTIRGIKYRQAREFDGNGKPARDIDFTDHRFPDKHTNPHQHEWLNNGTQRSKEAKPLDLSSVLKIQSTNILRG